MPCKGGSTGVRNYLYGHPVWSVGMAGGKPTWKLGKGLPTQFAGASETLNCSPFLQPIQRTREDNHLAFMSSHHTRSKN